MAGVLNPSAPVLAPGEVAHGRVSEGELRRGLMRLKWTLWKRSYRQNVGKLIGTIFGVLYAGGALVGLVFAMLGLTVWSGEGSLFPDLVRGLGVLAVVLWLVIPVFAFGIDDTLDPRAFAVYPRRARALQPGLFAAAAISLPTLLTAVAIAIVTVFEAIWLVAFAPSVLGTVGGLVLLLPANLAGLALCLLLPRAVFAHQASRSSSRGGREIGGVVAMILMLGAVYGLSLGAQSLSDLDMEQLGRWAMIVVDVLAWTPLGAAFAVPMDLAEGHLLAALVRALVTAAALVLVWRWWGRSLDLAMASALSGDASSGSAKVTGLVPRFAREDALGASIGRALRYWRRDTRYLAAIGIYPLIFVFFGAMGLVLEESRPMFFGLLVFMAGMTGLSLANEVGFDGPAGWVNITAGMSPRANLLGRVIAMAVLIAPPTLVLVGAVAVVFGYAHLLPMVLPAVVGMMLAGWASSVAIGVLLPYQASPPGTNPMKDKSASSANAMLSMGAAMLVLLVPQLPALGLAIAGLVTGSLALQVGAGVLALVVGAVLLVVALRFAERRLERRYPDLFQKVRAFL